MSGSNCYFLTFIRISQEAGKLVWYSHVFKNFPQFVVIHTVKGFNIVNEAEVDFFFLILLFFSVIEWMLAVWSLVPLLFLNPTSTSGSSQYMYCWSLAWRILSMTLLACEKKVKQRFAFTDEYFYFLIVSCCCLFFFFHVKVPLAFVLKFIW